MTEQEIEQARADVDQLDIEQLRCGVLLQLLHIEALKKERDALMSAAKLALDALSKHGSPYLGHIAEYQQAEEALRQAGVK